MTHRPAANLVLAALLVLAPLAGRPERLGHPTPWLALVITWLVLSTQPQLGPRRLVTDASDRFSALAILVALVTGLVVAVVDFGHRTELRPAAGSPLVLAGALTATGGLLLRLWSIRTLGRFFTGTVQTAPDQQVVQHGPYRLLRHPSYSGAMLAVLGLACAFGSAPGAIAALALGVPAYVYRMTIEERALIAALGESYRTYRERTWRIVPFVY